VLSTGTIECHFNESRLPTGLLGCRVLQTPNRTIVGTRLVDVVRPHHSRGGHQIHTYSKRLCAANKTIVAKRSADVLSITLGRVTNITCIAQAMHSCGWTIQGRRADFLSTTNKATCAEISQRMPCCADEYRAIHSSEKNNHVARQGEKGATFIQRTGTLLTRSANR